MPLTKAEVKALLAMPEQKKQRGRKPKDYIDTSVRNVVTWFRLGHKMMDFETKELMRCENPNCSDTRTSHMVAEVNGKQMCRRCFLDGWLSEIPGQVEINDNSSENA